jgi:hypothetical protein
MYSFTPVLMGPDFLFRTETNYVSHLLFIPLVLAKFRYWQGMLSLEFQFAPNKVFPVKFLGSEV